MKKKIHTVMLLALLLLLLGKTVYAADAGIGIEPGQTMPDFSVSLTDGTSVSLSEILEEKDLLVLNIFASWCGPCEREFPEMEEVYQANRDRMEILSLSGEPDDTMEIIAAYKAGHHLTFPMGLTGGALHFLRISGFPTSIFIDRNGMIGMIKVGAFTDKADFENKVRYFLSPEYNGKPLDTEKAFNFTPYLLCWYLISMVLLLIGRWGILRKAGRKGWHSLVPLLNVYEEYDIVWNGWFGILADLCVPAGMISNAARLPALVYYLWMSLRMLISLAAGQKLAKAFGKGRLFGVLLALPFFKETCRLILGAGRAQYMPAGS